MENSFFQNLQKRKLAWFTILFFIIMSGWWFTMYFRGLTEGAENDVFANIYCLVALLGGVAGLFVSKRWGGYKSMLGRAVGAFALGLLGQFFGQLVFDYYLFVLHVETPYPSIADIGFFSTGIFYGYGAIQLMKVAGVNFSLRSYSNKALALVFPVLWAIFSYWFFLKGYQFDWSQPIVVVLDLISPVIDAAYLSLAILAYLLSRKWLGGFMKWPILFLLVAIISEAVADFHFIYQASRDTWYAAGTNDYLFLVTFTLMALALMQIGTSFDKINEG